MLILAIVLMYKAFKGERFKLPIVGDFAEKQINIELIESRAPKFYFL